MTKHYKHIHLTLILVFFGISCQCQCNSNIVGDLDQGLFPGDLPYFQKGSDSEYQYIYEHLVYPKNWRKDSINGKVYIKFTIDTCGNISNINLIRGLNPKLDTMAINLIKGMPKWHPAKLNGKSICFNYIMPIRFGVIQNKQEK